MDFSNNELLRMGQIFDYLAKRLLWYFKYQKYQKRYLFRCWKWMWISAGSF